MIKDVMEIASVMCKSCEEVSGGCCKDKPCGNVLREARRIYDAGYRKHKVGKWLSVESDVIFKCSLCDAEISTSWDYENDDMFNYCPCCGAKMKGGG